MFIDVDRLSAGVFDSSLLQHIQAASHFLLILSPGALDRCLNDDLCEDWVHKEILCALEAKKNIVPILDPKFVWPGDTDMDLPEDMRDIKRFNAVNWIHEYQEACLEKAPITSPLCQSTPERRALSQVIKFLKEPVKASSGPLSTTAVSSVTTVSNVASPGSPVPRPPLPPLVLLLHRTSSPTATSPSPSPR